METRDELSKFDILKVKLLEEFESQKSNHREEQQNQAENAYTLCDRM